MADERAAHFVTALARGLDILRCFDRPRAELSVSDIARRVGLAQPTTWRLCRTLLDCGYLVRGNGTGLRVGAPVLALGYAAIRGTAPADLALPHMRSLADTARGSTSLSKRQALEMISVERADGEFARIDNPIGWSAPLPTVASGLATLAALPAASRETAMTAIARNDPAWQRHAERIGDAVDQLARCGFVRLDRMLHGRYVALAAPLFEIGVEPVDQWAISVGQGGDFWSEKDIARAGDALVETRTMLVPAFTALASPMR